MHENDNQDGLLNNFDETPIGGGSQAFVVAEYAHAPTEKGLQDYIGLTLVEKIRSKGIKIKLDGLEELRCRLAEDPQAIICEQEESPIEIHSILKQNNPACLEKALQCFQIWMQGQRSWESKEIKQVIENGFINGKGNVKKLATDLLLEAFDGKPEECQQTLIQGLKSKTPKLIGGYLAGLHQLLLEFGIKKLKYLKPFMAEIIRVMNTEKLPVVKNEGMNILKNGYKWLGKDFFASQIDKLKDNIKKQLDGFWESYSTDKEKMMSRRDSRENGNVKDQLPIKEGNKQENRKATIKNDKKEEKEEKVESQSLKKASEEIDVYEISDPIEILKEFDEKWAESVLNAEKWNLKNKMLQEITSKCSVPKINPSEHRHLIEMIRRLLNDSNFNVVLSTLRLTTALAKGLRKNFAHSAKMLLPLILPKLRDKKTQMIEETMILLKEFSNILSPEEVGEDIKAGLKDKAAGMRNCLTQWLADQLERRYEDGTINERLQEFLKSPSLVSLIENLLNDPNSDVRASSAILFGRMISITGENSISELSKTLNNKNLASKVNEAVLENLNSSALMENRGSRSVGKSRKKESSSSVVKEKKKKCDELEVGGDFSEVIGREMKKINDMKNWQSRKEGVENLIKLMEGLSPGQKLTTNLTDFFTTLKARLSDPNKQLIKLYICLFTKTFEHLSERDSKIHCKMLVADLCELLPDKTCKNELYNCFQKMAVTAGIESIIASFGPILAQEATTSAVKVCVLQFLLLNKYIEQSGQSRDLKEYPKGVVACLCDKSNELRSLAEKIFRCLVERMGMEAFRNEVKDIKKEAFRNDVTCFLDRFSEEQNNNTGESLLSMSVNADTSLLQGRNRKPSPSASRANDRNLNKSVSKSKIITHKSSMKNSRSKSKVPSASVVEDSHCLSFTLKSTLVSEGESFAPLGYLTENRLEREQSRVKHRHSQFHTHPVLEELDVLAQISLLFSRQLCEKMYSNNYRTVLESAGKIRNLCKDQTQYTSIRELYDLLIKWAAIRLYGGNIMLGGNGIMEMVIAVLMVLEKKKVVFAEYDIDLIFHVVRDYVLASHYEENANTDLLKSMCVVLVELSSGDRIVHRLLLQFMSLAGNNTEFFSHKHVRKSFVDYYKKILAFLSCHLVHYFSNGTLLEEAAKIPHLREDEEFVRLLCEKFHEGMLREFGFVRQFNESANVSTLNNPSAYGSLNNINNNLPSKAREVNRSREESQGKTPGRQVTIRTPVQRKKSIMNMSIQEEGNKNNRTPLPPTTPNNTSKEPVKMKTRNPETSSSMISQGHTRTYTHIVSNSGPYELDGSKYPVPSQHSPLGENLKRLEQNPFNQSSLNFFGTLLQPQNQNSEKISSELQAYSNTIYVHIFNALICVMRPSIRDEHSPEEFTQHTALTQSMIKCPNIFCKVDEKLIEGSIRFTVDQLVYEDENRGAIEDRFRNRGYSDFKGDLFIKGVNGVMLRILDHAHPLYLLNVFLSLLIAATDGEEVVQHTLIPIGNKSKKIGLLMRCINRISNAHFSSPKSHCPELQDRNIEQFLLLSKEYLDLIGIMDLQEFEQKYSASLAKAPTPKLPNNTEDSIVMCICSILRTLNQRGSLSAAIITLKQTEVIMMEEMLITEYLQKELGLAISHNNTAQSKSQVKQNHERAEECEEMKRVVELLSRNKTFQQGIEMLRNIQAIARRSGRKLNYREYFTRMNFQSAFIDRVSEHLNNAGGNRNSRSAMSSHNGSHNGSRVVNHDIQNKLERLKMKLEGINGNGEKSCKKSNPVRENCTPVRETGKETGREVGKEHRQMDLKKKIEEMKNKVNMSTANRIR